MGVSVKEKRDCVSSLSENGKFSNDSQQHYNTEGNETKWIGIL